MKFILRFFILGFFVTAVGKSAYSQIDLRQIIPDSQQYMIPVTDSLIAGEYWQKYLRLDTHALFRKADSICWVLATTTDTFCVIDNNENTPGFYFRADSIESTFLVNSGDTIFNFANVKNYGAKGDGVTDDTDSIMAVIAANDNIYFPPGTYIVSQILIDVGGKTLFGSGPLSILKLKTLQADPNKSVIRIQGPGTAGNYIEDVTIRDLAINGSASDDPAYIWSTQNEGINALLNTEDLVIQNVTIYNVGPDCIDVDDDNLNLQIVNCHLYDAGKSAMHLYGVQGGHIHGNYIHDIFDVAIELLQGATLVAKDVGFHDNVILNVGSGIRLGDGDGVKVYSNFIRTTTGSSNFGWTGDGIDASELDVDHLEVFDNYITGVADKGISGKYEIIRGNTVDGATWGITGSNTSGTPASALVEGNTVKNLTGTWGIQIGANVQAIIRGNFAFDKGISSVADSALIANNYVKDVTTIGISVTGEGSQVLGNEIINTNNQGISVSSGAKGSYIVGNLIDDFTENGILLSGIGSVAIGNKIKNSGPNNSRAGINLNADSVQVYNNSISEVRRAVIVGAGTEEYTLTHNVFENAVLAPTISNTNGHITGNMVVGGVLGGFAINKILAERQFDLDGTARMANLGTGNVIELLGRDAGADVFPIGFIDIIDSMAIGIDSINYINVPSGLDTFLISLEGDGDPIWKIVMPDTFTEHDHDWYEIEQQAMPGAFVDSIESVIYTKQNVVLNRDSLFTEGVELSIHPRESEEGTGDASELSTIKMYGAEDSTFVQIDAIKFGNYAQMEIVTQSGFQVREFGQTGQFVINNDAPVGSIIVYPTTGELQNQPYGTGTFANNDATYMAAWDVDGNVLEVSIADLGDSIALASDHDWYEIGTTDSPNNIADSMYNLSNRIRIGQDSLQDDLGSTTANVMIRGGALPLSLQSSTPNTLRFLQTNSVQDTTYFMDIVNQEGEGYIRGGGGGHIIQWHGAYTDAVNPALLVDDGGDLRFSLYPNTRNDAGNPVNVLTTDATGGLESHPVADLVVPDSTWRKESDNSHAFGYEPIWRDSSVRVVQWFEGVLAQDSLTSTRLAFPKAGSQTVNGAGAIRIDMPSAAGWDACEVVINLRIREDLDDTEYDISLAGSIAPSTWSQASATVVGTDARQIDSISFGSRQTDVLPSIWLEDTSGSWTNANVTILDVIVYGTNRTIQNWRNGWNIVLDNVTTGDVYQENRNITQILPEAKTDTFRTSNDTLFIGEDGDFVVISPGNPTGVGNAVAYFDASGVLTSEAGFHYVETTNQFTTPGKSIFGNDVSTGASIVEIGEARSGVGNAYIDLHSQVGNDWDGRLIAWSNGTVELMNNFATGAIIMQTNGADRFQINSAGRARLHNYTSGTAFNFADVGMIGFTSLGELNTMSFQEVADSVENLITSPYDWFANNEAGADFTVTDGFTINFVGQGAVDVTGTDHGGSGTITIDYADPDASSTNELQNLGIGTRTSTTYPITITSGTGATLGVFTSTLAGLAPSSGGGTTNFLRADGAWAAPPGGDGNNFSTGHSYTASSRTLSTTRSGLGSISVVLPVFSTGGTNAGLVPGSNGGGSGVFLNGNGSWTTPGGSSGIYGGSGTIPSGTIASIGASGGVRFNILSGTGNNFNVTYNNAGRLYIDDNQADLTTNSGTVLIAATQASDAASVTVSSSSGDVVIQAGSGTGDIIDMEANTIQLDALTFIGNSESNQLEILTTGSDVLIRKETFTNSFIRFDNDNDVTLNAAGSGGDIVLASASGIISFTSGDIETLASVEVRIGGNLTGTYDLENDGTQASSDATTWTLVSDRRIKKDIRTITDAYEKVSALRAVSFDHTDQYLNDRPAARRHRRVGYIAQEFQTVFPDYVVDNGGPDNILSINHDVIGPYAIAAVQQLIKDKREMETRIDYLEQQIQELIKSQKGKK